MSIAFPGYVSDVHAADALDPAWGNAIRDRAIQVFDTSTNRDAAIVTPQTGQVGVLTTLSTAGLYVRAGATVGWRAPWNIPWGIVATPVSSTSSAQNAITTVVDITSMTMTFTAVANRQYRVKAVVPFSGTSGDTARAIITDGAGTQIHQNQITFGVGASTYSVQVETYETYAAGAITRKLRAVRQAGAGGNVTVSGGATTPTLLSIEDVGPTGAPS